MYQSSAYEVHISRLIYIIIIRLGIKVDNYSWFCLLSGPMILD